MPSGGQKGDLVFASALPQTPTRSNPLRIQFPISNHKGFTLWMAGGGVKGGFSHGETEDHGYEAITGGVHIHDWHATILHLLGFDHEKLNFRFGGRNICLTDVYCEVMKEILA